MRGTINAVTSSSPSARPITGLLHSNPLASGPRSGNSVSSIGLWSDCSSASITERREFERSNALCSAVRSQRIVESVRERHLYESLVSAVAEERPASKYYDTRKDSARKNSAKILIYHGPQQIGKRSVVCKSIYLAFVFQ